MHTPITTDPLLVDKPKQCDQVVGKDSIFYLTHSNSFEKYISWSNEKPKIAETILAILEDKKDSLLDIGAGDGTLTRLLETRFAHITAIEPGAHLFDELIKTCSSTKYNLIHLPFEKTKIEEKFDIILASHSFRYISNPFSEIYRIKNLLKNSGSVLLVDLTQDSDYWKFYRRYEKYVRGENSAAPVVFDYNYLLKEIFNVKEVYFTATLSIPSVDDAISILDFFLGVEFSQITKEIINIKHDMQKEYDNGPVNINFQQIMYICSKS